MSHSTKTAPFAQSSSLAIERLRDMADGRQEEMRTLAQLYVQNMTAQLQKLGEAIRQGKSNEMEDLAHKMAGASAMMGMQAIVPILREMESLPARGDVAQACATLVSIQTSFSEICAFLNASKLLPKMPRIKTRA